MGSVVNAKKNEIEVDSHKLVYHPQKVVDWLSGRRIHPLYVEIGPTNACNHRCKFCALDFLRRGTEFIKKEIMISTFEEFGKNGVKSVMFGGEGEPLLHPDLPLFMKAAKSYRLDVAITTNGSLFTESRAIECLPHLTWMRFSFDGGSPESYADTHGVSANEFDKVVENIKTAVSIRNEKNLQTTIGVQCVLLPHNADDIMDLAKLCKFMGVDNLQVKPYSRHPNSHNYFDINYEDDQSDRIAEELSGLSSDRFEVLYRKQTIERLQKEVIYDECHGTSFFALIDAYGNVIPCNMFYGQPEFTYGNLNEQSFSEIWESERRVDISKRLCKERIETCRKGCRLDAANRYLHRIKHPHPHDNFL
jgi:radical SAM protein with 4Fe4S-binding SPASM domain